MSTYLRPGSVALLIWLAALPGPAQEPAGEPRTAPAGAPASYLASGPRELFAKGVEFAERGAVQEAKTLFRALTVAYPDLPEPHINLAVLLAAEGGTEESAQEAEAAMRAHPLCRAAFDLEFQRQIGPYGASLLAAGALAAAPPATPATAAPPPASEPPEFDGEVRIVRQAADPCLNFRPRPDSASTPAECLPPATRVRWLETAGDWTRVSLRDGREGWMATAFLARPGS